MGAKTTVFTMNLKPLVQKRQYLNNDFEGGAVRFEHFNYTFFPEKGDLLIFPSDYLYLHEALLVTAGVRYVIVSWANVK